MITDRGCDFPQPRQGGQERGRQHDRLIGQGLGGAQLDGEAGAVEEFQAPSLSDADGPNDRAQEWHQKTRESVWIAGKPSGGVWDADVERSGLGSRDGSPRRADFGKPLPDFKRNRFWARKELAKGGFFLESLDEPKLALHAGLDRLGGLSHHPKVALTAEDFNPPTDRHEGGAQVVAELPQRASIDQRIRRRGRGHAEGKGGLHTMLVAKWANGAPKGAK